MELTDQQLGKEALLHTFQNLKSSSKMLNILDEKIKAYSKPSEYLLNVYQVIGDIIQGIDIHTIIDNINSDKIGWKHKCFEIVQRRIEERDNFIVNPFEVEKGVLQCKKCGSERVFSYSKQVRSGDESSTTFAQCVACKASWVYSG